MIEILNLYKKFDKSYLYDNFSLSFPLEKVTSIIGPSGCGKTTLLRIIAGLENFESGKVKSPFTEDISFVFQEDRLLPWLSAYDNIKIVLKKKLKEEAAHEKTKEILELLDLKDDFNTKPGELSGGMRRRVAIGRALAYDAPLLIMDEPFKGLDEKLKDEIINKLTEYWSISKKTVILVTHDIRDAVRISQRIYEFSGFPVISRDVTGTVKNERNKL